MAISFLLLFAFSVAIQPDSQVRVHWKGAAEIVLALCTRFIDANDDVKAMDEDKVAENNFY